MLGNKVTILSGGFVVSKWAEIRNDFICEDSHKIYIDGWLTEDDSEEGVVLARIDMNTKNIEYFDDDAKTDCYAQEVINETLSEIDRSKTTVNTMDIDDVVRRLNDGFDRTKEELDMCKKWLLEYQAANDMSLRELDDMCFEDSNWVFDNIFG